jgi:hypothetical protein
MLVGLVRPASNEVSRFAARSNASGRTMDLPGHQRGGLLRAAVKISLLSEMVERAQRLSQIEDPGESLRLAFVYGMDFLAGQGRQSHASTTDQSTAARRREMAAARAAYDLLRHRALAWREQNQQLEDSVGELATESLELHARLWEWQARAGALKVQLGRRQSVTPRPEPAPMIGTGRAGKAKRDPAERMLEAPRRCEVELELTDESIRQSRELAESHGWGGDWRDESPLVVLAHGLAALELDPGAPGGDGPLPEAVASDSPALGALRYRIFELTESKRILAIRQTAFQIDNRGMGIRLRQLEREVAQLEHEVAEQEASRQHERSRGWLARLRAVLADLKP